MYFSIFLKIIINLIFQFPEPISTIVSISSQGRTVYARSPQGFHVYKKACSPIKTQIKRHLCHEAFAAPSTLTLLPHVGRFLYTCYFLHSIAKALRAETKSYIYIPKAFNPFRTVFSDILTNLRQHFSHGLWESGIWEWLGPVFLVQGLSGGCTQGISWGYTYLKARMG